MQVTAEALDDAPTDARLEQKARAGPLNQERCTHERSTRLDAGAKPNDNSRLRIMRAPLSRSALVTLSALSLACVQPGPLLAPPPPPAREPKAVEASRNRTWDAVIERFAEDRIPIRTMERASGFLVTEPMTVPASMNEEADWADCGTAPFTGRLYPTEASYSIVVRGDSARSTVRATVRWTTPRGAEDYTSDRECATTGNWEAALEEAIAARAEGRERRDVSLRSLLPRADTMPLVVADQRGVHWTVRPVASATGRRGFEFWGPDGEVRFVDGAIQNWRWLPATDWHRTIAGARVIRKKQPSPRKGAASGN